VYCIGEPRNDIVEATGKVMMARNPILLVVLLSLLGVARASTANEPWNAWETGDIDAVASMAQQLDDTPEREHLLFLCSFVRGQYESALERYAMIAPTYARYEELDGPVIDCYFFFPRWTIRATA
jgi:hypothetical protein